MTTPEAQNPDAARRTRALNATIATLDKKYGRGAVMRLGEVPAHDALGGFSTGSLSLDLATGCGGCGSAQCLRSFSAARSPFVSAATGTCSSNA